MAADQVDSMIALRRAFGKAAPPEKVTQEAFEGNDRHLRRLLRIKPGERPDAQVVGYFRVGEIAHEIPPAQFAVGYELESQLLLSRNHAPDMEIFERLEFFRRRLWIAARRQKLRRPQKTSHMVGAIGFGHLLVCGFESDSGRNPALTTASCGRRLWRARL